MDREEVVKERCYVIIVGEKLWRERSGFEAHGVSCFEKNMK
jgi:hypothetical protein